MAGREARDGARIEDGEGPLYLKIAEDLLARLRAGEFPVGSMLPTELNLASAYGVSRHTLREALRVLEELDLVARTQGSGTSVIALEPPDRFVQEITDLDQLLQYPENTRLFLLKARDVTLDEALAARLGLAEDDGEWLRISGIRRVRITSAAICLTTVYVRARFAGIVEDIGTVSAPVYRLIAERYGLKVSEVELEMSAVPIGEAEAAFLDVPAGSAGLMIVRRYRDQFDKVFEVSESLHPADRFTYRLRWRRSAAPAAGS